MDAAGLEALGVPAEYSEIAYATVGLGGATTIVLKSPSGKLVQVMVSGENKVAKTTIDSLPSSQPNHSVAGKWAMGNNLSYLTAEQQQLIKNAESISTAKPGKQVTVPRDLNEQVFWKQVQDKPTSGRVLEGMNNDPHFPESAGFKKMEAVHYLPDGKTISIHYQYNTNTGKAYDMKIITPKPKWPQSGTSLTESNK